MDSFDMLPTLDELLSKYADVLNYEGDLLPEPGWEHKIVSYMVKTHQRKAKKIGYDVALVYVPNRRYMHHQDPQTEPLEFIARKIYIRVTLYNETNGKTGFSKVTTHHLPLESLGDLFVLRNAIKSDQLFDYYLNFKYKDRTPGSPPVPDNLLSVFLSDFLDNLKFKLMYSDCNFEFGKYEDPPKMFSQFIIDYRNKNPKGEIANIQWKLECIKIPYVKYVPDGRNLFLDMEQREMVWDSDQLTKTSINVSQDQLAEMIDGIYFEVSKWFDRLRKK